MAYGMTYDEYWHGKPILARYYREKHKVEIEQRNQELWLQGLYFYDAVAVAMNNAFSKHAKKYIDKPFELFPKTEDEKKEEIQKIRQAMYDKLNAWADAFNKKLEQQNQADKLKQNGDT